jgi:outer membrane protein OmpA-like peptidoglycan-associated protein
VTTPEIPGAPPAAVAATGAVPAAVGAGSPAAVPDAGKASIYTKKELPIEQKTTAARITGEAALPAPPAPPAEPAKPAKAAGQQPRVSEKPAVGPRPGVATRETTPEIPGAPPAAVAAPGAVPAAVGAEGPAAVPDAGKASIYTKKELPIEQKTTAARITGEAALPAPPAEPAKPAMASGQRSRVPKKLAVCPTLPDEDVVTAYAGREQVIVEFDSDSAVLRRKYLAALKALRKRLKENSSLYVTIEGHADYRGSPAYNLALSRRRAIAVKNYLIRDKDVAATRITIEAFGCTVPIDDNRTIKGRQKNRRAVVLTIRNTR